MSDANAPRMPRGFGRMDAKKSSIFAAMLAGVCLCYWFCLPALQSLVIPNFSGGKDGPWVLRPERDFRFGAMAVMACLTIPVLLRPFRRKWAAEDAALGSQYDPFHGQPGRHAVFFVKSSLLLVVYASALLFYLLSWVIIGTDGIEEHLPWTTRKYSFQDIAVLETIPAGGRTASWASKGGPWYDINLKSGRTITLSEDKEGCTPEELHAVAAFIADRSGLAWQRGGAFAK